MNRIILFTLWFICTASMGVYFVFGDLENFTQEEPQSKTEHLESVDPEKTDWKDKEDAFWKENLSELQYNVCRLGETERAHSGFYNKYYEDGVYKCSNCGQPLFSSDVKYDSGSGWPSFYEPISEGALVKIKDTSHGMTRTEIRCGRCDAHLGHVFDDGPEPTGKRYCINSVCLLHTKKPSDQK